MLRRVVENSTRPRLGVEPSPSSNGENDGSARGVTRGNVSAPGLQLSLV
ncbi:MAG: hypothetical protein IKU86_01850 [Thermoguttaceae bacterium]|nr:hypothetical protein [Thermoguttaceae bacterium]